MGTEYSFLFLPVKENYIPDNNKIKKLIEYLENENIINLNVNTPFRHYSIIKKLPNNKPPIEGFEFRSWVQLKKEILNYLKGDITNIEFFIETTKFYNNIFLKYKRIFTPFGFGTISFGIYDPPREYWYGDQYKKGETSFCIETSSRGGPHNLDAEKNFFKILKKDKELSKILNDFEAILGTKLKIDSEWSW